MKPQRPFHGDPSGQNILSAPRFPSETAWLADVKQYEADVLSGR
jgi:hypothetical protein